MGERIAFVTWSIQAFKYTEWNISYGCKWLPQLLPHEYRNISDVGHYGPAIFTKKQIVLRSSISGEERLASNFHYVVNGRNFEDQKVSSMSTSTISNTDLRGILSAADCPI